MKIFLIRHGRQCGKLYCNVDVDLSEEGYRQASLLGGACFMKTYRWFIPAICCGPWKRLRQPISTGMWSISYGRS